MKAFHLQTFLNDVKNAYSITSVLMHSKFPQTQWLKTTPIYDLIISTAQESRCRLAGSSAQSLTRLRSEHTPELTGCWQTHFLTAVGWGGPLFLSAISQDPLSDQEGHVRRPASRHSSYDVRVCSHRGGQTHVSEFLCLWIAASSEGHTQLGQAHSG